MLGIVVRIKEQTRKIAMGFGQRIIQLNCLLGSSPRPGITFTIVNSTVETGNSIGGD